MPPVVAKDKPPGRDITAELVAEFLRLRKRIAADEKRKDNLRDLLLGIMEKQHSPLIDEVAGKRLVRKVEPRLSYSPEGFHAMVAKGHITEDEFAGALVTSVDKKIVQAWMDNGTFAFRHLQEAGAIEQVGQTEKIMVTDI